MARQALAGLPGEAMARVRHSLEEERRAAAMQRIEYDLTSGRHTELIGEIEQLSVAYPLDESLIASLMLALYRSGRQGDALAAYRDFRDQHVREQGIEPGPALAELHARILRRDPGLMMRTDPRPGASGPPRPPDTLPPDPGQLIGRAAELRQLTATGDCPNIRVITGMPGIGKSALAVHAARALREQFPDGQLFLSLSAHDARYPVLDPAEALNRLLSMIGIPGRRIPQALPDRAALWRAELERRRLVVVLDDAAGPDQVQSLLPDSTSPSRVLITARASLGSAAELALRVLVAKEAADLFTRITGPVPPDAQGRVVEIIQLCGGLPLAIQLSARRHRDSDPAALGEMPGELTSWPPGCPGADAPGREIEAAFELSYRILAPGSRRFFRRLGLHPGTDITEYAAAALAGVSLSEASAELAELLSRHLLEAAGTGLRLHDLIRQYATALAAREEPDADRRAAVDRLLQYYLDTAERADRLLRPHACRTAGPTPRAPGDVPDISTPAAPRAGWNWNGAACCTLPGTRRARAQAPVRPPDPALAGFLEAAGHWKEAVEAHGLALQACRDLDDPAGIAHASLNLSLIAGQAGDLPDAFRHAERAAVIFKSLADQAGHAAALDHLGILHGFAAQYRQALAYHQEAAELYRTARDQHGMAVTLNNSAIACYYLGRYPEVVSRVDAALKLYRQTGDRRGEAVALANLGTMQRFQALHRDAMGSYERALAIFRELGGEQQKQAQVYQNIGCIHLYKRSYDDALAAFQQALDMFRRIGDLPGEGGTLNEIGETLNALEDRVQALAHHRQAAAITEGLGDSRGRVNAMRGMAEALGGTGHDDEAAEHYRQALHIAREISDPFQEGKVLEGMAGAALQTQDSAMARIYWQQALDIYEQLGIPDAEAVRLRLETLPPGHAPWRDIA